MGLVGAFGNPARNANKADLIQTIDLLGSRVVEQSDFGDGFLAVATIKQVPVKRARRYEDDSLVVCLAGDLLGTGTVPWDKIVAALKSADHSALADLRGNFAIAAFDKKNREVLLAADRRSQFPLFYRTFADGIVFSTEMSTFCRLAEKPRFNVKWLYELMFLNFPIGPTTYLESVKRIDAGTVLTFDLAANSLSAAEYARPFSRRPELLKGKQALDHALDVFRATVPKYYDAGDGQVAHFISGGWDSRTALSFFPRDKRDSIHLFGYGMSGCDDIKEGAMIAKAVGLKHAQAPFDQEMLADLPRLMFETVHLTAGAQSVLRAPLLHVYRKVTGNGQRYPVVMTGLGGDQLFRGHNNMPAIVSRGIDYAFRQGKPVFDKAFFTDMFGHRADDATEWISQVFSYMEQRYGKFNTSDCHIAWVGYEVNPKYFLGEMMLAGQYATVRTPYWNDDIVQLAHDIEYSALTYSWQLNRVPDMCAENKMHAHLLLASPDFAKIPIAGVPVSVVYKGKTSYELYRFFVRGPRRLIGGSAPKVPIQDWKTWMNSTIRGVIDDLVFSPSACIRAYFSPEFLAKQQEAREPHWLGKLASVEIMLREIETGWRGKTVPTPKVT